MPDQAKPETNKENLCKAKFMCGYMTSQVPSILLPIGNEYLENKISY